MKRELLIKLGVGGVFLSFLLAFQGEHFGSVTLPLGRVYVQKNNNDDWGKAKVKMLVFEMDKVKTLEKSRCEVMLVDQNVVRIGEKTIIELVSDEYSGEYLEIQSGKAWIKMFLESNGNQLKVRTPTSVCAIRGTVYRLSCDLNHTNYRVYEGGIAINPVKEDGVGLEDTTFYVNAGEELTLVKDFEEYKRQQEEAIKRFEEEQIDEFERFLREEQDALEEFERKDYEAFQQFKSFHYDIAKFDLEKDGQIDWVKWNLQRDEQIQR